MMTLDLAERTHGGKIRNLSGKEAGELAREHFNLDELDDAEGPITVLVPKEVYNLSPSFFCGMFGASYAKLGEGKLLSHYQFKSVPEFISKQVHFGVKLCSETYN
ncbi:hypothetical protein [Ruegeria arenilitoris]|uniref:hypothetical protein n=1 Tax=Ruegeria arenilitoris TaxID=1173585 RepID=UPI00147A0BD0|nr:hypothetical protein [Ruegeria arenilitoris]